MAHQRLCWRVFWPGDFEKRDCGSFDLADVENQGPAYSITASSKGMAAVSAGTSQLPTAPGSLEESIDD